jgi:hypothetical protein
MGPRRLSPALKVFSSRQGSQLRGKNSRILSLVELLCQGTCSPSRVRGGKELTPFFLFRAGSFFGLDGLRATDACAYDWCAAARGDECRRIGGQKRAKSLARKSPQIHGEHVTHQSVMGGSGSRKGGTGTRITRSAWSISTSCGWSTHSPLTMSSQAAVPPSSTPFSKTL